MFDWDDLRYLLAVADHGSTLAAARHLNVNQSTVQRRLGELERSLGLRLVERWRSGYRLTTAGTEVIPHAREVAAAIDRFAQRAADAAHAGMLRLTCPEPIAIRLAQSGFIERFHTRHPDIRVQFVLADRYIDLTKGRGRRRASLRRHGRRTGGPKDRRVYLGGLRKPLLSRAQGTPDIGRGLEAPSADCAR